MIQKHGGDIYRYSNIIDFSANINPLGMPESAKKAVIDSAVLWECYPDPTCRELTEKISEYERAEKEKIVCGNGADDIIYRLVHALKPKRAVISEPSFSEYEKALSEVNCSIKRYFTAESEDFEVNEKILDLISTDTDIVFLCTPSNPAGRLISAEVLRRTAERCREAGAVLVSDESFMEFTGVKEEYSLKNFLNENCIIVKAFTKFYATAGLRIGYAVCGGKIAEKVRNSGQYWSVSVPAQSAGKVLLGEKDFALKTVEYVKREREYLEMGLESMGIKFYPSSANFILIRAGEGLDDKLLSEGIMVRNCSGYHGLDGTFYRIAVRKHSENEVLLEKLRRCRGVI